MFFEKLKTHTQLGKARNIVMLSGVCSFMHGIVDCLHFPRLGQSENWRDLNGDRRKRCRNLDDQ